MVDNASEKLRIDKWLWYARILKTRSLASKFVQSGNVRVNSDKVTSAAHGLKVDDVLTIAINRRVRILKVLVFGTRRGPASEAALLYEDLTPEDENKGKKARIPTTPSPNRRPDKRERRKIDEFKTGFR